VPHQRTFELLRTHLLCERALCGDLPADHSTILAALRAGSAWLNCPFVAPANGARLWAERDDRTTIAMGAEGVAGRSVLRLRVPRPADVRVRRNGAAIEKRHSAQLDLDVADEGGYRVEARIDGRLWLLSNPVHPR
jgi:hypothetical protein